jgi:NAD(P)-dependent dehydrogenase (short-subunit alcohol dehydrogenase family)
MSLNSRQTDWHGQTVWLLGASTGIGRATASALHAAGARVWVSARPSDALQEFATTHPGSRVLPLDCTDAQAVRLAAVQVMEHGALDCVVYCAGYYRPQRAMQFDLADMLRHEQVNYVGALYLLDAVLPSMLSRSRGHISLVSSVAGYGGLPNGLAYGPTKAALTNLAETLYMDLHDRGIDVSVIHPGFVETPLTAQNRFAMPALISPDRAARAILQGWSQGKFDIHFPKRFTLVMKALQWLPYAWYFRLVRKVTGL